MRTLRLLSVFAFVACVCHASDGDQALIEALRWYYRWMSKFPVTAGSADCKVAIFTKAQFAYCEPTKLYIDIDTPDGSPAAATNITGVDTGFALGLRDFLNHRYFGPPQIPSVRRMSIPKAALKECKIDIEKTRQLAATAIDSREREDLLKQGITLRFPLACEGDPFYFVYFMMGGDVEWIWQIRPGIGYVWSYDKQSDQRAIPPLAIQNLAKPKMWYAPE